MIKIGSEVLFKPNACIFAVTEENEDGTFVIENEFELYHDVSVYDIELVG